MSANFDWQTEEDDRRAPKANWDDPPEPQRDARPRRRLPWRLIAVVAILATMAGGIVWWRVDQRIDATLQAFRTDVIASHNLVQRAVVEEDAEIFRSVLSGREPAWTAGEMDVFNERLFFDRSPMGLAPVEGSLPVILPVSDEETPADERIANLEFSPDLNEAVITVDQPYRRDTTGETVILQQTTVFRRGDFRWLLAPPLDEFWGDWVTSEGDYLTLIYPRRDESIAGSLAETIDGEIGRLCETVEDIDCSADLHLTVRLDTDPAALASLSQPLGALRRAREQEDILELPTPTLVGLPVEDDPQERERGLAALSDGYARHILGAAIAQAVGWQCCQDSILFSILTEYELAELGLLEWPIAEDDHRRVMEMRLRLSDVNLNLRGRFPQELSEDQIWELRAAVDFLVNGLPGASAAGLQRILDRTRNFDQFLDRVLAEANGNSGALIPDNIDLAWWLFALGGRYDDTEPSDLPDDQELYLACTAVDGNQGTDVSRLLRYQPGDELWTEMYNLQGFIWMSSLPDPDILLMQEFTLEFETWRTNVWRDGGISTAYRPPQDDTFSISFGETDAAGRNMVAYTYDPESERVETFRVDLAACDESCATAKIPGRPYWSPDGEWAVYYGDNSTFPTESLVSGYDSYILLQSSGETAEMPLSVGPGDALPGSPSLTSIGEGRSPFWLDNDTYGYVRTLASDGPAILAMDEIVLATLDEPTPYMVIPAADLYQFLPEELSPRELYVSYVATHPGQPDRLFIVVLDERDSRAYVMLYDLKTRLPEVRLDLHYNLNHSLSFSPDGRYLVMTGHDRTAVVPGDNSGVMLLHNIAENRTIPLMTRLPFFLPSVVYDWTEDGRWLALALADNLIGLVAPDEGYTRLLPHGYGACTSVAWLQP